jgi:hypothetical protein
MSQLKVNSIVPVGGLPSGANGGILQVVQAVKTDTFSHNSTTFTDITGLSASITPSSSSSKIFCDARIYYSIGTGSGSTTIKTNFVRGSTTIAQPTGSSTTHQATMMSWTNDPYMLNTNMNFLDSPATTSATTYKVQVAGDQTAATIYVNRYYNSDTYHAISTLTLYEVTA